MAQTGSYARLETMMTVVCEQTKNLNTKVDGLSLELTAHLARDESLRKDVSDLKVDVNGNGKSGLKADVKTLMEWMGSSKWFGRVVAAAAITTAISAIVMLILNFN